LNYIMVSIHDINISQIGTSGGGRCLLSSMKMHSATLDTSTPLILLVVCVTTMAAETSVWLLYAGPSRQNMGPCAKF
jgi:hypothetical protein